MSAVPLEVAGAQPPGTSVLVPSNGATLSGSTYLDASASNATGVLFLLFGGAYGYSARAACAATPTYYGWICSWDTTTVPNGTYALVSEASGAGGNAFSKVTITVNNPGPSTFVVSPPPGSTLDPAQGYVVDAVASPGATQVSIDENALGTTFSQAATPTANGWQLVVPGAPPSCGPFPSCKANSFPGSIQSVASYAGGVTVTSPPVSVTVIVYGPPD